MIRVALASDQVLSGAGLRALSVAGGGSGMRASVPLGEAG
jgi:hypothetical protein